MPVLAMRSITPYSSRQSVSPEVMVFLVLLLSDRFEVPRVDAHRLFASVMEEVSLGNRTTQPLIDEAMSEMRLPLDLDSTVAMSIRLTQPPPAGIEPANRHALEQSRSDISDSNAHERAFSNASSKGTKLCTHPSSVVKNSGSASVASITATICGRARWRSRRIAAISSLRPCPSASRYSAAVFVGRSSAFSFSDALTASPAARF